MCVELYCVSSLVQCCYPNRMTAVCVELYCVSLQVQCCYPHRMTAVCVELYCVSLQVQCCYPHRMTAVCIKLYCVSLQVQCCYPHRMTAVENRTTGKQNNWWRSWEHKLWSTKCRVGQLSVESNSRVEFADRPERNATAGPWAPKPV